MAEGNANPYGWEISLLFALFMCISCSWQVFVAIITFLNSFYGDAKNIWLTRLKEEVLEVGVISLVLVFIEPYISCICVSTGDDGTSYSPASPQPPPLAPAPPPALLAPEDVSLNIPGAVGAPGRVLLMFEDLGSAVPLAARRVLAGSSAESCPPGHSHLFPPESISTAHYLLFFVALVHIAYSLFTFTLTLQRFRSWTCLERRLRLEEEMDEGANSSVMTVREPDPTAAAAPLVGDPRRGSGGGGDGAERRRRCCYCWPLPYLGHWWRGLMGRVDPGRYKVLRALFQLRARAYGATAFGDHNLNYAMVCENAMQINIENVVARGWLQALIVAIFTLYTTEVYQLMWIGGISIVTQLVVAVKLQSVLDAIMRIMAVGAAALSGSSIYRINTECRAYQSVRPFRTASSDGGSSHCHACLAGPGPLAEAWEGAAMEMEAPPPTPLTSSWWKSAEEEADDEAHSWRRRTTDVRCDPVAEAAGMWLADGTSPPPPPAGAHLAARTEREEGRRLAARRAEPVAEARDWGLGSGGGSRGSRRPTRSRLNGGGRSNSGGGSGGKAANDSGGRIEILARGGPDASLEMGSRRPPSRGDDDARAGDKAQHTDATASSVTGPPPPPPEQQPAAAAVAPSPGMGTSGPAVGMERIEPASSHFLGDNSPLYDLNRVDADMPDLISQRQMDIGIVDGVKNVFAAAAANAAAALVPTSAAAGETSVLGNGTFDVPGLSTSFANPLFREGSEAAGLLTWVAAAAAQPAPRSAAALSWQPPPPLAKVAAISAHPLASAKRLFGGLHTLPSGHGASPQLEPQLAIEPPVRARSSRVDDVGVDGLAELSGSSVLLPAAAAERRRLVKANPLYDQPHLPILDMPPPPSNTGLLPSLSPNMASPRASALVASNTVLAAAKLLSRGSAAWMATMPSSPPNPAEASLSPATVIGGGGGGAPAAAQGAVAAVLPVRQARSRSAAGGACPYPHMSHENETFKAVAMAAAPLARQLAAAAAAPPPAPPPAAPAAADAAVAPRPVTGAGCQDVPEAKASLTASPSRCPPRDAALRTLPLLSAPPSPPPPPLLMTEVNAVDAAINDRGPPPLAALFEPYNAEDEANERSHGYDGGGGGGAVDMEDVELRLQGLFWWGRPQLLLWVTHVTSLLNSLSVTLCMYFVLSYGTKWSILQEERRLLYIWLPLLAANLALMIFIAWVVVPLYTLATTTCTRNPRALQKHIRRLKEAEGEEGGIAGFTALEVCTRCFRHRSHHHAATTTLHARCNGGGDSFRGIWPSTSLFLANNLANQGKRVYMASEAQRTGTSLDATAAVYKEFLLLWLAQARIWTDVAPPLPRISRRRIKLQADVTEFRAAFRAMGCDRSGITTHELFTQMLLLMAAGTLAYSKAALRAVIAEIDSDGDGEVSFSEFLVFLVFCFLDADGKGYLELPDVVLAARRVKMPPHSDSDMAAMVELADPDGDGKVGLRQFSNLFKDVDLPKLCPKPPGANPQEHQQGSRAAHSNGSRQGALGSSAPGAVSAAGGVCRSESRSRGAAAPAAGTSSGGCVSGGSGGGGGGRGVGRCGEVSDSQPPPGGLPPPSPPPAAAATSRNARMEVYQRLRVSIPQSTD